MTKRIRSIVILQCFLAITSISAQNEYFKESHTVTKEELLIDTYPQDSTANAFYFYEKGYSRIENKNDYDLLTDYSGRLKILNEKGYDNATITLYLYTNKNDKEDIKSLVAYTHTLENGKVVRTKVQEDQIFREVSDENHAIVKFTFPNLAPGAVLTYSYTSVSPFLWNFHGWRFQRTIPVQKSSFVVDIPGNYIYNIKLVGALKLSTNNSYVVKACFTPNGHVADCMHSTYVMEDIPAFTTEKYMTAAKNYRSRIAFELSEIRYFDGTVKKYTKTWKSVDKLLERDQDFGFQLRKLAVTKTILPKTIRSTPIALDKAKAIYRHICDTYTWNEKNQIFRKTAIKDIIKTKTGNIGSINILLHNTLKQQGFDVTPVLASTRSNGYPTLIHPVVDDFNYLVVQLKLNDNTYLLDAAEKNLPFGMLPFRCLNRYGRLMDFKNGSSWIDIEATARTFYYFKDQLTLTPEHLIEGKIEHAYGGYHGAIQRNRISNSSVTQYIEDIESYTNEIEISDIELKNIAQLSKPLIRKMNIEKPVDEIDGLLYLNPFSYPFFTHNPFKLNRRTYPVDFGYKDNFDYLVQLTIPEGYAFQDLPKNKSLSLPNKEGRIILSAKANGQTLLINYKVNFNSSYYPVEYYDHLKAFYNHLVDINTNTIVTVKKL